MGDEERVQHVRVAAEEQRQFRCGNTPCSVQDAFDAGLVHKPARLRCRSLG